MSNITFYTLGVFGLSESDFFQKLIDNKIDTFCDIRRRRAVRGSQYSFVNSKRLQNKLSNLRIRYVYEIDLAPSNEIRGLQKKADEENKIQKRKREELGDIFKSAYISSVLLRFDFEGFFSKLSNENSKNVAFFCVERAARACHRSLVIKRINELYPSIETFHL